MNRAVGTLSLKTNKDQTHLSSYHPLSLINTDLKTRTLAKRIETVLLAIIHPDNTV